MAFTEEEVAYLKSQPLARIAMVGPGGQPDVAPVGFEFDGTYFWVGGRGPERTRAAPCVTPEATRNEPTGLVRLNFVEDPTLAEYLGNYSYPDIPWKPNLPRSFRLVLLMVQARLTGIMA